MTARAKKSAALYFVIHFMLEVVCFFMLYSVVGDIKTIAAVMTVYNGVAFIPQMFFGTLRDLFDKFHPGIIGVPLLFGGFLIYFVFDATGFLFWISLILLCTGNALLHISGAELTIRTSGGKLSPVAIYVSGGAFGVITGQLLSAETDLSFWWIALLGVIMFPLVIYGETLYKDNSVENDFCDDYNFTASKTVTGVVIAVAFLIVMVRTYLGYAIPTSWNTTVVETILLYVSMGVGKALGGVLSDAIGLRKTAFISIIGALPFLILGDQIMIISLLGIMFFSMTMPITVGMLVSVMKIAPGAAFGVTTIAIFFGSVMATAFKADGFLQNCMIIVIASAICFLFAHYVLVPEKEVKNNV